MLLETEVIGTFDGNIGILLEDVGNVVSEVAPHSKDSVGYFLPDEAEGFKQIGSTLAQAETAGMQDGERPVGRARAGRRPKSTQIQPKRTIEEAITSETVVNKGLDGKSAWNAGVVGGGDG